jgi:hypothetical protein
MRRTRPSTTTLLRGGVRLAPRDVGSKLNLCRDFRVILLQKLSLGAN